MLSRNHDSRIDELGQVVVHPSAAGCDVKLVQVAVDADEVDVLAAVVAPVAVQLPVTHHRRDRVRQRRQVVVHPAGAGGPRGVVKLVHVAVDTKEVDVPAAVAAPIGVQRRPDVRRDGARHSRQVVVGPACAGNDEKLMDVLVCADVQHVLTAVGVPVGGQRRVHIRGGHRVGQRRQVVVDPACGTGCNVKLVQVAVGADEEDMLAAVAAPVAVESGVLVRRHGTRQPRQIVVGPVGRVGASGPVQLVNVVSSPM